MRRTFLVLSVPAGVLWLAVSAAMAPDAGWEIALCISIALLGSAAFVARKNR